jgi:hypothetical protein
MEDRPTMNEMQTDSTKNNEKSTVTENPGEMDRREALATLGKFVLLTTPVMTTLLTSKKAAAFSLPPGPP